MKKLYSILSLILILSAAPALFAQTITPSPSSLTFTGQAGGSAVSQPLTLTISGNVGSVFVTSNAPWLKVNDASSVGPFTTTSTITVKADPSGLPNSTTPYSGTLTILSNGANINVSVSFTVTGFGVNPGSATFAYQLGSPSLPPAQTLTLTANQPFSSYTATFVPGTGGNWLVVTPGSNGVVTLALNGGIVPGLTAGTYNGNVRIQINGLGEASVPVALAITSAPTITVSPTSVNLFYQLGSAASTNTPVTSITLTNPGTSEIPITAVASVPSGNGNWLTVTPATPTIPANGSTTVSVSYNTAQALSPNTYSGANVSLFLTGASNARVDVPVTLRVSASPFLKLDKTALTFSYQVGTTTPAAQNIVATSTQAAADAPSGQQMVLTLFKNNPSSSTWLSVPTSLFSGSATPITVSVNPTGLAPNTYRETVTVLGGGAANSPQTFDVTFTVSNDPMITASFGGCSTSQTTCTLNFPVQTNQNPTLTKPIRVQSSNGQQASFTATAAMTADAACGNSWLSTGVTAAVLSADTTFQISVNPTGITAPKSCSGTITIAGTNPTTGAALPNSPVTIPVNMYVSTTAMLVPSVNAVTFSVAKGAFATSSQFTVASTSADNIAFTTAAAAGAPAWLIAPSPSATTTASGQNAINVIINPTSLDAGTYTSSIVLTATTAGVQNSPVTIPVVLTVTTATLSATPTTLAFQQVLGTNPPSPKTVQLKTDSTDINFTTSVATAQGTGWLSATAPSATVTLANPVTATIGVNGSALPAGTYNGTVTFTPINTGGTPVVVNVTLEVQPGSITATPTSLSFSQVQGGPAPDAKTVAVNGTPGALTYTVAVSTDNNSGNWLSATPASGTTNSNVSVSVNSGSLAPGQYTGKVTITSTGASGSPLTVPITLTVLAPQTFTAAPTTLNFSYIIGTTAPATQTVTVTTAAGAPFTATASTSGGGQWLSVTPTSGTGTTTLTASINTSAITGAGDFTGTIAITSPNAATNPAATVTVKLSVTAIPKPVITAVSNAASYVSGAVSPGENIVIFGTGIGPASIASATVTGGAFPTTVGSTQVFFDNIPAPILYVSGTQTSVMVPYGVAGRASTNMRVVYSGVTSDTVAYNVVSAAPGVYTANASGSGQGAILNQDYSPNTASRPAEKNSVVAIYVSGEGVTSPASTDGRVAPSDGSGLNKPVLPVTATIGGQTATVEYYGSAPGILYGVMQVNVRIPANAASGNLPIVINVGSASTQGNVTVAVH